MRPYVKKTAPTSTGPDETDSKYDRNLHRSRRAPSTITYQDCILKYLGQRKEMAAWADFPHNMKSCFYADDIIDYPLNPIDLRTGLDRYCTLELRQLRICNNVVVSMVSNHVAVTRV